MLVGLAAVGVAGGSAMSRWGRGGLRQRSCAIDCMWGRVLVHLIFSKFLQITPADVMSSLARLPRCQSLSTPPRQKAPDPDSRPTASMCFSLISSWYARCSRESTVWRSDGTVAHTSLSSDARPSLRCFMISSRLYLLEGRG